MDGQGSTLSWNGLAHITRSTFAKSAGEKFRYEETKTHMQRTIIYEYLQELDVSSWTSTLNILGKENQDMSLYYESAPFLGHAALKSQVFSSKTLKSTPKQVFALVSEASKWSIILKEVIENSQLLVCERKVSIWHLFITKGTD